MPKALVINPNTTAAMSSDIALHAARVFTPPWECDVVQPRGGPQSIETWVDMYISTLAMLDLLKDHSDADGILIVCFGDPGLFALREILDVPVVGLAEANFLTACMLGMRFGVIAGLQKDAAGIENLLWTYGLEKRCAGFQTIDLTVLDMHQSHAKTLAMLVQASLALADKGAEVLVLGCAGLSGFRQELALKAGLPVIEPVEAACWQLRSLVELGLRTSRSGIFAKPSPKQLTGIDSILAKPLGEWLKKQTEKGFENK